jgi:hypothetical protein
MVHDKDENIVEKGIFWDFVVQLQIFFNDSVRQTFLPACVKQAT